MTLLQRIAHALRFCNMVLVDEATLFGGDRLERWECSKCGRRELRALRWEEMRGAVPGDTQKP